jgi:hypothetical protein
MSDTVRWEYAQLHWSSKRLGNLHEEKYLRVHLPGGVKEDFADPADIVGALNDLGEDGWEAFATEQMNTLTTGDLGWGRTGFPIRRRFWLKRPVP